MLFYIIRGLFGLWVMGAMSLMFLALSDGFFGGVTLKLTAKRFLLALVWPLLILSGGGWKTLLSRFASVFNP